MRDREGGREGEGKGEGGRWRERGREGGGGEKSGRAKEEGGDAFTKKTLTFSCFCACLGVVLDIREGQPRPP